MNRLEQDAADALAWHERDARHRQGYAPRPPMPMAEPWRPVFTEQQQKEHDEYVARHNLPF